MIRELDYITKPTLPFKRKFNSREKKALINNYPTFSTSRIDADGRILLYREETDYTHTYITENDLKSITPAKIRKLSFKQLYDTLGEKQLSLLKEMANTNSPLVVIVDGFLNKTITLNGEKRKFTTKEINTLLNKGFMTVQSIIPNELLFYTLTNLNIKWFKYE